MKLKTSPFNTHTSQYLEWFEKHPYVFESEVKALREVIPFGESHGIEVGLGPGNFSVALGIKEGVEPSEEMRNIALDKGIEVFNAPAEKLPYKDLRFDFVLMASCIHYFNKLIPAFKEANRVLKPGGILIVGCIDKNSIIGKSYEAKKSENIFYKQALFYSIEKVAKDLKDAGFGKLEFSQTLFEELDKIKKFEPSKPGYGEGSYVVIKAVKK